MRDNGLVVDDLPDEVLVYDLETHQAHCLNRTAALVWRACDGQSTAAEIARRLTAELDAPFNEEFVLLALNQLESQQLLQDFDIARAQFAVLSRRQMVRRLGLATAIAVPLVTSIVAPRAVEAATCNPPGHPCTPGKLCCSTFGCNPVGNVCF